MKNPMNTNAMHQIAAAHRYDLYREAEQHRLAKIAQGDLPRRSLVKLLIAIFQREEPAVEVVATTEMPALTDPYKTQPLKAIRRTDEIRRTFYENIRQGNALQELEEQNQWQVGGV